MIILLINQKPKEYYDYHILFQCTISNTFNIYEFYYDLRFTAIVSISRGCSNVAYNSTGIKNI